MRVGERESQVAICFGRRMHMERKKRDPGTVHIAARRCSSPEMLRALDQYSHSTGLYSTKHAAAVALKFVALHSNISWPMKKNCIFPSIVREFLKMGGLELFQTFLQARIMWRL